MGVNSWMEEQRGGMVTPAGARLSVCPECCSSAPDFPGKPADSMETAQASCTAHLILSRDANPDFCSLPPLLVTSIPAKQQGPRSALCAWDWDEAAATKPQHKVGFVSSDGRCGESSSQPLAGLGCNLEFLCVKDNLQHHPSHQQICHLKWF